MSTRLEEPIMLKNFQIPMMIPMMKMLVVFPLEPSPPSDLKSGLNSLARVIHPMKKKHQKEKKEKEKE